MSWISNPNWWHGLGISCIGSSTSECLENLNKIHVYHRIMRILITLHQLFKAFESLMASSLNTVLWLCTVLRKESFSGPVQEVSHSSSAACFMPQCSVLHAMLTFTLHSKQDLWTNHPFQNGIFDWYNHMPLSHLECEVVPPLTTLWIILALQFCQWAVIKCTVTGSSYYRQGRIGIQIYWTR
jgi:hypothetical protein